MAKEKPTVPPGAFQLNPDDFKTGNFLLDTALKNAIKDVNKVDFNHNGVPDVAEIAPVITKLLPLLVALNEAIDFEALSIEIAGSSFVKDKEVFKQVILELGKLAESSQKLLPH